MGITNSLKQVAADFMVGRAVRKITEKHQEEQERAQDDPLLQLGNPEEEELRKLLDEQGVDHEGAQLVTVSMADLVRRILYDSGVEDPEEVLRGMGWDSPSAEVSEMEAKASERRVDAVDDLSLLVHAMAQAALLPSAKSQDWPPEEFAEEYEFCAHATLAIIANLVDMGLLETGLSLSSTGVIPAREDDDE